jgi:hypothetical protein
MQAAHHMELRRARAQNVQTESAPNYSRDCGVFYYRLLLPVMRARCYH